MQFSKLRKVEQIRTVNRLGATNTVLVVVWLIAGLLIGGVFFKLGESYQHSPENRPQIAHTSTHEASEHDDDLDQHSVTIRKPSGPPRVGTGLMNVHGNEITVSCSTCHSTREPNHNNKTAADLDEFHSSLKFSHGSISCLSCHNSNNYDALKLADGTRIEFTEVMTLCAQCHGQQMRDFERGAHGGMTGYWDLSRGARSRNNCVDCHHAHSPQFPKMHPTFKPKDRFLHE